MEKKELNKIAKEITEEMEIINLLFVSFLKNKNIFEDEEINKIKNCIFDLADELTFIINKYKNK
ncbi:MAG: hypothetical protein K2K73_03140 [Ureaplasma sp.]|nr:hypothetical protein [Ureaplasma sp.]